MIDQRNIVNIDLKKDEKILNFSDFQKQAFDDTLNYKKHIYNNNKKI